SRSATCPPASAPRPASPPPPAIRTSPPSGSTWPTRDRSRPFAAAWDGPLHLLINGADLTRPAEQRMARRWESRFAVNHLGHFALASGLHRALAAARGARIVAVSSSTHLYSPVVFDDIHFAFRPHEPLLAYAQSKTANVLFAVGASIRWADDGITANA